MNPNRHLTLSVWSLLWLAAALSGGNAAGQQAKSELVGTWTPIAIYTEHTDGTKFETFGLPFQDELQRLK